MKLPLSLLESPTFQFPAVDEFIQAGKCVLSANEMVEIDRLVAIGLPPIASPSALAIALGVSPSLIWSMTSRTARHYRTFRIPKGYGVRFIQAPRVALKVIQTWLAYQLASQLKVQHHVHGFVKGRSHISAAAVHCEAEWILSLDLKDFFPTIAQPAVQQIFQQLGYSSPVAKMLGQLCCLNGHLAQGAPSSPVISNFVFHDTDKKMLSLCAPHPVKITRYADDIVLSGLGVIPTGFEQALIELLEQDGWVLAKEKRHYARQPSSLKVHGLLVDSARPRLSKGYRNKIRAYQHMLKKNQIQAEDLPRINGHIGYSKQVQNFAFG